MLKNIIEKELNNQLNNEAQASQIYLSMASWSNYKGFDGVSEFLFINSEEERKHMIKIIYYINSRGGFSNITNILFPKKEYNSIINIFKELFEYEKKISKNIEYIADLSLKEKDYLTYNFIQWYISEQIEEEKIIRSIINKLSLINESKLGLYLFDKEIKDIYIKNKKK